jgi:CRP-like cAMP-binding protein
LKESSKLSPEAITAALKKSLVFSGLSDAEMVGLSQLAGVRRLEEGEYAFFEGDAPDYFYILIAGRIKISKHSSQGKEVIIAFFGPGEMFGEVAVFEGKVYPASAQAAVSSQVATIRKEKLLSFLGAHPQVALRIINVLGGRLRDAQVRLKDLAGERVEQRLARTLLMLSVKLGVTLPFTRQEIADMAGTATETAIRILGRLKDGGIITSTRGEITIIDQPKLRLLSEGPPQV